MWTWVPVGQGGEYEASEASFASVRSYWSPSKNRIGSTGVDCVFLLLICWDLQPWSLKLHQLSAFSWTDSHQ